MPEAKQTTSCFHCGEDCVNEKIEHNGHDFCCQGCKTVYSLLNETGLVTYYELEEQPPGRAVKAERGSREFLDLDEVKSQLIEFREGSKNRVTFYLPSVHCSACIWLLERLDKLNGGVLHSEVNFLRKELTVHFDAERLSLKELVLLLEDLGYPPDLQRDGKKKASRAESRKLLVKLGVAGFAFGNIMLFSFPEYLSLEDASLHAFTELFGYLNLLLALPVLLYSDTDYLRSAWKSVRVGYLTIDVPIALGILTLFGRSAFEILSQTGVGYFDSFAGLVFFLLIGKWYQRRTYEALAFDRDFKSYFPIAVSKITPEGEEVCMLEDIQPGDRLKVLAHQIIPADSVLMKGTASIDYSFVNGESDVVEKTEGEYLFAGGRQTAGVIEIQVVKEVSQSYLTGLWNQEVFSSQKDDARFSDLIDNVSRYFSIGILSIAFGTLFFWLWIEPRAAIDAFTAVLIIACPCALALSMPFAAGNVSRILGKLGLFVKNTSTLERLSNVSDVVFDKTGTLTQTNKANIEFVGNALTSAENRWVKSLASSSTHPLSIAVRDALPGRVVEVDQFFDHVGSGVQASVEGHLIKLGSSAFAGPKLDDLPSNESSVYVSIDGEPVGRFIVQKHIREGVPNLIRAMQNRFKLHLLSGDHEGSREKMRALFGSDSALHFNQSPMDKLHYIQRLQSKQARVLMFGDGLNDAGALKQAEVGIAVADDVFSFSPACDAILQADRLNRFDDMLRYVRKSMLVVRVSILISLLYNLVGLYFAVQAELTPIVAAILMPLSSVTVVGFVSLLTALLRPRFA